MGQHGAQSDTFRAEFGIEVGNIEEYKKPVQRMNGEGKLTSQIQ